MANPTLNRREPLVNEQRMISDPAYTWLRNLSDDVDATPTLVVPAVEVATQSASISTTPIPTESLGEGLYEVAFFAEVVTAAVTSSSLIVTIGFTSNSVSKTWTSTTMNGNLTTTVNTGRWLFRSDAASPISYATTYASNGAGEMVYNLWVTLTKVSA